MRKRSILRSRAFSSAVASRVGLAVVMVSCFSVSWGGGGMGGGDMVMRMEEVRETGGGRSYVELLMLVALGVPTRALWSIDGRVLKTLLSMARTIALAMV